MQYSREVEYMFLVAQYRGLMHEIVRSYLVKYRAEDERLTAFPDIFRWVCDVLRQQKQISIKDRDNLACECCRNILDRLDQTKGKHNGLH